jgi:hypothetical protein
MATKTDTKPVIKTYFDVKVETNVPAIITYRILAENAQQAAAMIRPETTPTNIKYQLVRKRDLKMTVYDAGSLMIRFIKQLAGR